MKPIKLWCGPPHSRHVDAAIGFDPPTDATALSLHAGALALLMPDGPRAATVYVGGPAGDRCPRVDLVEKEPGWFHGGPAWTELIQSQTVFGSLPLHLHLNGAPADIVSLDVPMEAKWRTLYEALIRDITSDPAAEAALKGISGLGRARLDLWRSLAPGEVMLRVVARVQEALDRVAAEPDRRPTDAGGRSPHVRSGSRAVLALPQAFRTGAVGLSSEGRPVPLLFPSEDEEFAYDTPLNRAARFATERALRAAVHRADVEESEAAARAGAAGTSAFLDARLARRAVKLSASLREAARELRSRLTTAPFLKEASRTSRPAFPHPLPANPGYRMLRESLADDAALRKGGLEEARLRRLFKDADREAPALHELYERWVGAVLVRTIRNAGFALDRGDATSLSPGGPPVSWVGPNGVRLKVFAAPAFRRDRAPIAGVELVPAAGDARSLLTPDFVVARTDERRGPRPLLLIDATLSSSPEVHRKKALYARRICHGVKRFRLGAMRRVTAVACTVVAYPGRGLHFESDDSDLRFGSAPLTPGDAAQALLQKSLFATFLEDGFGA